MSDDVTPRPEEERPFELAEARAEKATAEYVGRAEREAATIYATSLTRTPGEIRTVLALAWLKGFMVGYGEIVERLGEITAQYEQDVQA